MAIAINQATMINKLESFPVQELYFDWIIDAVILDANDDDDDDGDNDDDNDDQEDDGDDDVDDVWDVVNVIIAIVIVTRVVHGSDRPVGRVGSKFCRILAGRVGSAFRIFNFFTYYFLVPESIWIFKC